MRFYKQCRWSNWGDGNLFANRHIANRMKEMRHTFDAEGKTVCYPKYHNSNGGSAISYIRPFGIFDVSHVLFSEEVVPIVAEGIMCLFKNGLKSKVSRLSVCITDKYGNLAFCPLFQRSQRLITYVH